MYRGLSHHLYLQALCYFPAAFAGFIIVEVTDALGFSGHLTIKAARMLVGYFLLVKSVRRGCVILGEALRRPELIPTILGLHSILGVGLGPGYRVGQSS